MAEVGGEDEHESRESFFGVFEEANTNLANRHESFLFGRYVFVFEGYHADLAEFGGGG